MTPVKEEQFQLKADLVPMTVIKLTRTDLSSIQRQLVQTIEKAPNYFNNAPILIDIGAIERQSDLKISSLIDLLKEKQMVPVAIRGANDATTTLAHALGLATLNASPEKPSETKTASAEKPDERRSPTRIITKPIRAGTQVYAKGGDLIVLSSVNSGAECFADGSIHVYGALRGRALAGVSGDKNARIFCRSLEAELIAIAGHYQTNEDLVFPEENAGMVQIYLNKKKLQIETI